MHELSLGWCVVRIPQVVVFFADIYGRFNSIDESPINDHYLTGGRMAFWSGYACRDRIRITGIFFRAVNGDGPEITAVIIDRDVGVAAVQCCVKRREIHPADILQCRGEINGLSGIEESIVVAAAVKNRGS